MVDDLALVMSSSLDTFVASQPWFFLVSGETRASSSSIALRRAPTATDEADCTLTIDKNYLPPTRIVAALRKRTAVTPGQEAMISVGRTSGADVIIHDESISRLHAWFRIEGPGDVRSPAGVGGGAPSGSTAVYVTDVGSKNGTRVAGIRLEPRTSTRLFPGSRVRLGNVELTLANAHDCWKLVRTPSSPPTSIRG